jgi:hypothetical protein
MLLALVAAASLATATPSPSSSPSPAAQPAWTPYPRPRAVTAFTARGRLTLQATSAGKATNFEIDLGVMRRTGLVRIDLEKIRISADDPMADALLQQLVPRGGVSIVFDQKTQMVTIWSSQTHVYFRSKFSFKRPSLVPTPRPSPTPKRAASPSIFEPLTQFDVYRQSLELTGHEPVNGHPASVYSFNVRMQKHGGKMQEIDGTAAFAEDLAGIPLQLVLTGTGGSTGNLRADLLLITPASPPVSLFAVPKGYRKAKTLLDLVRPAAPK